MACTGVGSPSCLENSGDHDEWSIVRCVLRAAKLGELSEFGLSSLFAKQCGAKAPRRFKSFTHRQLRIKMGLKIRNKLIESSYSEEDYVSKDVILNFSSVTDIVSLKQGDAYMCLDKGQIKEIYESLNLYKPKTIEQRIEERIKRSKIYDDDGNLIGIAG